MHNCSYTTITFIFFTTERNARKVVREIVESPEKARSNPEFYPPDKDKTNNDGSYKSFENTVAVFRIEL